MRIRWSTPMSHPYRPTYTVDVTGCSEGTVTLALRAGSVADAATNAGPATDQSADHAVTVDRTQAGAHLACTPDSGATNASTLPCSVTFDKAPGPGSAFTLDDVSIGGTASGWTAADLAGAGSGPYTFSVGGGIDGTLSIAIAAGAITDGASNQSVASATKVVHVDRVAPTVTAPAFVIRTGVPLAGSAIPVTLSWTAADELSGSGLASFELQRSTDAGRHWTTLSTAFPSPSLATTVASSGSVLFAIRAKDAAGNASTRLTSRSVTPRLVQDTPTTSLRYTGRWSTARSSAYSGGTVRYSTSAGAKATLTFTARAIALVTTTAASRGQVKVYLNGHYQTTLDLRATRTTNRMLVWETHWTSSTRRTLTLVVVGTSGRPRIDLDAFALLQ
jgi:hypothetical protein